MADARIDPTTTPPPRRRGGGTGLIIGALVVIVLLIVLWFAGVIGGGADDARDLDNDANVETPALGTQDADGPEGELDAPGRE